MLYVCSRAHLGVGNIKHPLVWLLILIFRSSNFIAYVTVLLAVLRLPTMSLTTFLLPLVSLNSSSSFKDIWLFLFSSNPTLVSDLREGPAQLFICLFAQ